MSKKETGILVALVCKRYAPGVHKTFAVIDSVPRWCYYDEVRPARPGEKRSGKVMICDAAYLPADALPDDIRTKLNLG
jgi:hypothetical protein